MTTLFSNYAEPLPYTLLSLQKYARIMGIDPVHFAGGFADNFFPVMDNRCEDVWPRYAWQASDRVSHHDLAVAIADAERDLANLLNYWPAPMWINNETHPYPGYIRPEYRGRVRALNGQYKGISTKWKKVLKVGQRVNDLVATATVAGATLVFSDEDGDGWDETATITVPLTTTTDIREIKLYFAGTSAWPGWEIRPLKSISIAASVLTIRIDAWLLIDPEQLAAAPTPLSFAAINLNTTANYVTSVDVYREYIDTTARSCQFIWAGSSTVASTLFTNCSACSGAGCTECSDTTQDSCMALRDPEAGIVAPSVATYDADTATWKPTTLSVCDQPDLVKLWYFAGNASDMYMNGMAHDPLDHYWAYTIAMLATARLEKPFCSCTNAIGQFEQWKTDIAFSGTDTSFIVDFALLANPFGTRMGEIQAYKRVAKMGQRIFIGGIV